MYRKPLSTWLHDLQNHQLQSQAFRDVFPFPSTQVHQIDFDDENNVINKNVFMHKEGEIWHMSASPLDKNIITTIYNHSK